MKCKYCGYNLPEGARFCTNCGHPVDDNAFNDSLPLVPSIEVIREEAKEWYYLEKNKNVGPFTETEMRNKLASGHIGSTTYVWQKGMEGWILLKDSVLAEKKKVRESEEWYYVENSQSVGPFTKSEMLSRLEQGYIFENTMVYKDGFEYWTPLYDTELRVKKSSSRQPATGWYYLDGSNSQNGPYSKDEMMDLYKRNVITDNSYVWKSDMEDWTRLKRTELYTRQTTTAYQSEVRSPKEWYYIDRQKNQVGPYTQEDMKELIETGVLTANTYIWKKGFIDWTRLNNSQLVQYVPPKQPTHRTRSYSGYRGMPVVQEKPIMMDIIFSIITCYIYTIYWIYRANEDANRIFAANGEAEELSSFLVVILSIFTGGLFLIYYFWKLQNRLSALQGKDGGDSIAVLILTIFGFRIVPLAIIQNTINQLSRQ